MIDLEVNGHKLKDLASRAIVLLESVYGFKLNDTQKYFLGKEIQLKSGKHIEMEGFIEKPSKINADGTNEI